MKTGAYFRIIFSLLMSLSIAIQAIAEKEFQWPDGQRAAVCLTYDDGLNCHLDIAAVDLDNFGFKGTFYTPGKSRSLLSRTKEWADLTTRGHELGNHTLYHPCEKNGEDWILPEYDLKSYTQVRIADELVVANAILELIDGSTDRTFAYTCAHHMTAEGSYKKTVEDMFSSARLSGPIPDSMEGFDVYFSPSWGVDSPSAEELINYVNDARDKGTVAVFMFHSVGGGYLNVTREAHLGLLKYLSENKDVFWVDTFFRVMEHVKVESERTKSTTESIQNSDT